MGWHGGTNTETSAARDTGWMKKTHRKVDWVNDQGNLEVIGLSPFHAAGDTALSKSALIDIRECRLSRWAAAALGRLADT